MDVGASQSAQALELAGKGGAERKESRSMIPPCLSETHTGRGRDGEGATVVMRDSG